MLHAFGKTLKLPRSQARLEANVRVPNGLITNACLYRTCACIMICCTFKMGCWHFVHACWHGLFNECDRHVVHVRNVVHVNWGFGGGGGGGGGLWA